jgi:hypothetical protein
MGVEENKSAVAEAIETFNDPDARREYLEIHDSSVSAHGLGSADPVDFEGVTQFYETLWSAFPDVAATRSRSESRTSTAFAMARWSRAGRIPTCSA